MYPPRLGIGRTLVGAVLGSLGLVLDAGAAQPAHVMFVTSLDGTGDLSSWADSGGFTGLQAGDAICQAVAGRANLANSGAYRAWLSDSSNDAYCRLSGLGGKVSAKCGQAVLPADAGPWQRTDGQPFAGTIGELAAGVVYTVASLDQSGAAVPGGVLMSGTDPTGVWTPGYDCAAFTSASSAQHLSGGGTNNTTWGWTQGAYVPCSTPVRLLCFESGAGPDLTPSTAKGVPVFATDATGTGDLSSWSDAGGRTGLAAGDQICQAIASRNGFYARDFYRAWLSAPGTNAASRITGGGPWVRLDGIEVAGSHGALTAGFLAEPLGVTETLQYLDAHAWTGSTQFGVATTSTCAGWTSSGAADHGTIGVPASLAVQWSKASDFTCETSQHLYCLCDQTLIASDGFESGDLSGWSSSQP